MSKKTSHPILEQIVITLRRVNQATSVYRAIALSKDPLSRLHEHIMETQYFTIIVDLNKIFDKSGDNLVKTIKTLKNNLNNREYQDILEKTKTIETKYEQILKRNQFLRNHIGAHLNKETIEKMYQNAESSDYETGLCALQEVVNDTVTLISSISILDTDLKNALNVRIGPKDIMDELGLEPKPKVIQGFIDTFFPSI